VTTTATPVVAVSIDLHGPDGRPLAAMRAHALAVHDALTLVAGDRSLTLAVWFEDGLSTR
jgi:hypothetical protein